MSEKKNLILQSISKPSKNFLTDVAEMQLDSILSVFSDSEILKEIPIFKWIAISNNIHSNIQSAFFLKKFANFIGVIKENIPDDTEILSALEDEEVQKQITDNTLIYLDRYQTEFKAKLLAELFIQTFTHKRFTIKEYNSLLFSIEQIHPVEGIDILKEFYDYYQKMETEPDENKKRKIWEHGAKLEYQTLATTGFLTLPSGSMEMGNLGGAYLNKKGLSFYENVVLNCIST